VILAIDQGTTGTTCLVVDSGGAPLARASREHAQHYPRPGWVEHDPREIWQAVWATTAQALRAAAGAGAGELEAIGITNQRETVVCWDRRTGEPLAPAIVWQDRRTAGRCDELRAAGELDRVRARTGLVLDPYFSATKIEWLLRERPELRERAMFGTIDAWLALKLCGEASTEPSNAARTLLYDITTGRWDPELCALFGDIPLAALPPVRPSAGVRGMVDPADLGLPGGDPVPLAGVAGDQQAALFGHG
jgi:glycerol kinase